MVKISNYQKITEKRVIFKNIIEMIRTWAISGLILTLLRLIFLQREYTKILFFVEWGENVGSPHLRESHVGIKIFKSGFVSAFHICKL